MKNSVDNISSAPSDTILDQYRAHLQQIGKSDHTVKAYLHDLAGFGLWFKQITGEDFTPAVVDSRDIREYKGYLLRQGRQASTINRRLIALSRFFGWAKKQGLAPDSPFEVLETVLVREQQPTAPHWLDRSEQLALIRAVRKANSTRDLAIIQTMLGTGLRLSELAALQVSDVEISERKGWVRVRSGKGNKAREIPLDNKTRVALESYLKERPQNEGEALFFGQRGSLTARGIDQLVRKFAYQARLEECTAHTLRHTFAKNLVDASVPLDQVGMLLGHESLDTTKIYVRPSREDLERAVRRASGEI